MQALWRALQYHDPDHASGQKFTTTLYRFVHWECDREAARAAAERAKRRAQDIDAVPEEQLPQKNRRRRHDHGREGRLLMELVREKLPVLSGTSRLVLRQYYLESRSMEEIALLRDCSKEKVRKLLGRAVGRLRQLCKEPPPPPPGV
jgi:RNA polymerase sigma factor (sigma-70 family)